MRHFERDLSATRQHLGTDVRQHQTATAEPAVVVGQARIVDVKVDPGVEKTTLADEQVRSLRLFHQLFGPAAVARVEDGLAVHADPQAERDVRLLVWNAEGQNRERPRSDRCPRVDLDILDRER